MRHKNKENKLYKLDFLQFIIILKRLLLKILNIHMY